MLNDNILLTGNNMYTGGIGRIGRDRFLEEVHDHLVLEQPVRFENRYVVVTQSLFILTGIVVVRLDELELFAIVREAKGMYGPRLILLDSSGHMFTRFINPETGSEERILRAVASVAPHIRIGFDPDAQFDYKRRHEADILRNCRQTVRSAVKLPPDAGEVLYTASGYSFGFSKKVFLCVTDRYLIFPGKTAVVREDVEWFFIHMARRATVFQVFTKDGKDRVIRFPLGLEDRLTTELMAGLLLPCAVCMYIPSAEKWWISRHGAPGGSLWKYF